MRVEVREGFSVPGRARGAAVRGARARPLAGPGSAAGRARRASVHGRGATPRARPPPPGAVLILISYFVGARVTREPGRSVLRVLGAGTPLEQGGGGRGEGGKSRAKSV